MEAKNETIASVSSCITLAFAHPLFDPEEMPHYVSPVAKLDRAMG